MIFWQPFFDLGGLPSSCFMITIRKAVNVIYQQHFHTSAFSFAFSNFKIYVCYGFLLLFSFLVDIKARATFQGNAVPGRFNSYVLGK